MALVVSLKLVGDNGNLVQSLEVSEQSLRDLGQTARAAEADARATAAGLGTVEMAARNSAAATQAYSGETRTMASAIDDYDERIAANTARLDEMRAKYVPLFAVQQQYQKELEGIRVALAAKAITEDQAAAAARRAQTVYDTQTRSLGKLAAGAQLSYTEVEILRAGLVNTVQSLAGGVGVARTFETQIFQIAPALPALVRNLGLSGTAILATGVAVTAIVAPVIAGAAAWNSYLASTKAVQAASEGLGRSIGASAGDLENVARSGAAAGDISVRSAREAETAFLNTGRIGTTTMQGLIAISRDYAATMNMVLSAAIEDLGRKFADPAKGAEELSRQLDLVDATTADYVRTLAGQNRQQEAQSALLAALVPRLSSASDGATLLGRAWHSVAIAASDAWDWMGKAIDRSVNGPDVSAENLAAMQARAAQIRATLAQSNGLTDIAIGPAVQQMRGELSFLDQWIARAQATLAKTEADADRDLRNRASAQAGAITRSLTPGAADLETLKAQQTALKTVLDDPDRFGKTNDLQATAAAYDRVTHALDTYLTPAQRAAEADRLATQALAAKTPAEKAAIAAAQKRLELAGQTVTSAEAEAQSLSAGNVARAQATQSIVDQNRNLSLNARATLDVADAYLMSGAAAQRAQALRQALTEALQSGADVSTQAALHLQDAIAAEAESAAQSVQSLNDQADAQKRVNDAVLSGRQTAVQAANQAQLDAALKPLLIAQTNAEGKAKETITRVINALVAAYGRLNAEQARSAAGDMLTSQRDELAMLERQRTSLGQSAEARATSIALLQAEQQARRAGIDLMSTEGQEILANARYIAQQNVAIERQNDAWDALGSQTESALGRIGDQVAEGKLSIEDWGDTVTSVLQDVLKEIYKLAVTAPIMNSLFGTNYATISDVGGIFGGAFAGGGRAQPNKVILVGENGPELINTGPTGVYVTPLAAANDGGYAAGIERAAAGGGSAAMPAVHINIQNAPGTTTDVVGQKQNADGSLTIEMIGRQLDDYIGSQIASGRGSTFTATRDRFGLNANAQLRRG